MSSSVSGSGPGSVLDGRRGACGGGAGKSGRRGSKREAIGTSFSSTSRPPRARGLDLTIEVVEHQLSLPAGVRNAHDLFRRLDGLERNPGLTHVLLLRPPRGLEPRPLWTPRLQPSTVAGRGHASRAIRVSGAGPSGYHRRPVRRRSFPQRWSLRPLDTRNLPRRRRQVHGPPGIADRAHREPAYRTMGCRPKGVHPVGTRLIVEGFASPQVLVEIGSWSRSAQTMSFRSDPGSVRMSLQTESRDWR